MWHAEILMVLIRGIISPKLADRHQVADLYSNLRDQTKGGRDHDQRWEPVLYRIGSKNTSMSFMRCLCIYSKLNRV